MVACSVRTKDGTIRDWKEQSTFCKKLDARRAAARIQFEERMGGDGWRVGASFLHRIGRLFTLTAKPRIWAGTARQMRQGCGCNMQQTCLNSEAR